MPLVALLIDVAFAIWLTSKGGVGRGTASIGIGLLATWTCLEFGMPLWKLSPLDASDVGLLAFIAAWFIIGWASA